MSEQERIYFISDFHLGLDGRFSSQEREDIIISFLDEIYNKASKIYILGDIFDFWYEYKHVVPKGFLRFFGKLCSFQDEGIDIHIYTGNHDMWMFGYLSDAIGATIHHDTELLELQGKTIFLGHGDGLGPSDTTFKYIRKIFKSTIARRIFRWIHPDIGMTFGKWWSRKSRESHHDTDKYLGNDKERLYQFCVDMQKKKNVDYFIFGHRHLPIFTQVNQSPAYYCNLGDWINFFTYAVLKNGNLTLHQYKKNKLGYNIIYPDALDSNQENA